MCDVCRTDCSGSIYQDTGSGGSVYIAVFIYDVGRSALGPVNGALAVVVYIVLGLIGLPIFTQGGGPGYIFQPSFGYIIGFAVAAYVNGKIANAKTHPSYRRLLGANFLGLFIVYAFGMIYYYVISNFYLNSPIGVGALFLYCFVLAVPGDIVLCIVAAIIGKRMIPLIQGGRLG